ncbi:MAG: transposase, partial [Terrimicrobiaceae bacterium]
MDPDHRDPKEYPRTLAEVERRFSDDAACRQYLFELRWPTGFRCPRCEHED